LQNRRTRLRTPFCLPIRGTVHPLPFLRILEGRKRKPLHDIGSPTRSGLPVMTSTCTARCFAKAAGVSITKDRTTDALLIDKSGGSGERENVPHPRDPPAPRCVIGLNLVRSIEPHWLHNLGTIGVVRRKGNRTVPWPLPTLRQQSIPRRASCVTSLAFLAKERGGDCGHARHLPTPLRRCVVICNLILVIALPGSLVGK
jgi:hypothetical protein